MVKADSSQVYLESTEGRLCLESDEVNNLDSSFRVCVCDVFYVF